ncbi:MAG: malate synthase A [Bacteroidota bacterium]
MIKPKDILGAYQTPSGVSINGEFSEAYDTILTGDALVFIKELHHKFNSKRLLLLENRKKIQNEIDGGKLPDFLPETVAIRESEWRIDAVPKDIQDRRVEITGPVERKMIINALNSGAKVFMADLEDSNSPSWKNVIEGQINLMDAVRKNISYTNEQGKEYTLNNNVATLMVRPRGLHMNEMHIIIDGEEVSASFFDFGLYFFHNVKYLLKNGSSTYFYLPKIEHYLEARLWNDVFVFAEEYLKVPQGSIKATVLVETILASFQLNEILWELRTHSAGLNCGRWDYIFSFIKKFKNIEGYVFPERSQVNMTVPFMRNYTQLVVQTCHKRNAHAIGGMAAQIPIKNNEAENKKAIKKVLDDKIREVTGGHDGTWVAHPGLVPVAMKAFNKHMKTPNQIEHIKLEDFTCTASDLLQLPVGTITENGLRMNINIAILYIESWLRGNGAAAIYNLMEDAATAEISRTQVWQWLKTGAKLDDGRTITHSFYEDMRDSEISDIKETIGVGQYTLGKFPQAIALFNRLVVGDSFEEFLTTPAYKLIN